MLLAIDVGNTNIVVGLFERDTLRENWRLTTDRGKTADEYGVFIRSLFQDVQVALSDVDSAVLASVVPPLTPIMRRLVDRLFHVKPLFVTATLATGIRWEVESPADMGADRIADCVGGYVKYGGPCIIIDMGTATTFNFITEDGRYLGGSIAPGVLSSSESLFTKTAKLPRIELDRPESSLGANTITQMQAGVVWGMIFMVEGMIQRMRNETCSPSAKVILTGGLSGVVVPGLQTSCIHDPNLTLDGLRILFDLNRDAAL